MDCEDNSEIKEADVDLTKTEETSSLSNLNRFAANLSEFSKLLIFISLWVQPNFVID